jgi:hypothetical protein
MAKKFKRPAGWYRAAIEDLVDNRLPELLGPLTPETAWRYVYAVVMWPQVKDGVQYLHLQESDTLKNKPGREFAQRAETYLAANLCEGRSCDPFQIVDHLGLADAEERLRQGFEPSSKRDQNQTGAAFETVIQVLIQKLTGVAPSRTPPLNTLQGFELAPVGYHSKPDLVLFGPRDFRVVISTKWTLRKERIGTYLHEAYFYKQRRPDLQVAFVVSEFNMNILRWLMMDPLTDRVYHVNKPMLLHMREPAAIKGDSVSRSFLTTKSRSRDEYRRWLDVADRVFDLSDLFKDVEHLRSIPRQVLDPDDEDLDDEDEADTL